MELALSPPQDFIILETIKRNFSALSVAWNDFATQRSQKEEAQQKLAVIFKNISNISDVFPELDRLFSSDFFTPTAFQYKISIGWMIRDLHFNISLMRHRAEREKNLTGNQFKHLKREIRVFEAASRNFDKVLAEKIQFPLDMAHQLSIIGTHILSAPLRIFIDDDDTGKHVSCFEIPQIYGFGETADEAVQMLNREILSICVDLCEDTPMSGEYEALKDFLDMVFGNEE